MIRSKISLVVACLLACTGAETADAGKQAAPVQPGKAPEGPPKATGDELPAAEALLDESVAAMGGAEKFRQLSGYYVESNLDMGSLGLKGVAKGWWGLGGFYNETEMPGIGQMKIGATPDRVWRDDPVNGLREITGKEAEQARWSATLCLIPVWREYFKTARTVAVTADADGKKLAEIELVSMLGDKVTLRIDVASKMPVSQTFTQVSPLGDTPTTVLFQDWREVAGIKVSFRQLVDASSLMQAVSVTTKLEINPSLAGVQFDMPDAANAVKPGAPIAEAQAPADLKKVAGDGKKKQGKAP